MMSSGQRFSQARNKSEAVRSLPSLAGRVATILLILVLLLPIVTAASMFGAVNLQLWRALPSYDPLLSRIERAQDVRGVVSGDDPAALKRLFLKLERMAALEQDAKRAEALHVLFHASGPGIDRPEIELDLSSIGTSAVVLIPDRPLLVRIAGAKDERGKLGLEGAFPFDLADTHDGLLAGFRIGAFGAGETASPGDYAEFQKSPARQRIVCAALDRWRRYFGVAKENLHIWSANNAGDIVIGNRSVTADVDVLADAQGARSGCAKVFQ